MFKNAIEYKGVWLMPGSDSHRLYTEKKWAELEKHMAELEKNRKKLEGR